MTNIATERDGDSGESGPRRRAVAHEPKESHRHGPRALPFLDPLREENDAKGEN